MICVSTFGRHTCGQVDSSALDSDLFSDLQRKQQLKSNICLRRDTGAVLKSTLCVSVLQEGHSAGLVAGFADVLSDLRQVTEQLKVT